ncbi:hypothetical protein ABW20_dc0105629 [Dactylellina cionopaga]|nr:hypothetical protein ABW20_dc0105629 [Dactylellina cionopaga]
MVPLSRTRFGKLKIFAFIGLFSIGGIVIHQLCYLQDFVHGNLASESIELIKACSKPQPTFRTSNEPSWHAGPPIPNIIHQIWKNSNISTYSKEPSHASWKYVYEPMNYTVKLWPEEEIINLIKTNYSWLLPTYQSYPQNIQRADLARLVVVHAEGGIYSDLDVWPRSVEELQCLQRLGLQAIFAPNGGNAGVSNHFFMAERGSEFLQWALDEAKRRGPSSRRILLPYLQVFWSTGPMMVTSASRQYASVYGSTDHRLAALDERYGKLVVGHAAGRSWHGVDGQVLNYISDHGDVVVKVWVLIASVSTFVGLVFYVLRRRYIKPSSDKYC